MDNNNQLASLPQQRTIWTASENIYQQPEPSQMLINEVIKLFGYFKTNFGTKFKQEEWGKDRMMIWAVTLTELQITPKEFSEAVKQVRHQAWQPTTPADFLALGRQAGSEYPDSYIAYVAAANRKYLHPAAHETAKRIGIKKLASEPEYNTLKIWNEVYKNVCTELAQDSAKFNQNAIAIEQSKHNYIIVIEAPKTSLEEQSALSNKYIDLIRKSL